jgi:thymidylate synthase (FAD)
MKLTLLETWGSDLEVVNNARVSFGSRSCWDVEDGQFVLSEKDTRLVKYLARGCTLDEWDDVIATLLLDSNHLQADIILRKFRHMPSHWAPFANGIGMKFSITAPLPIMRQIFKHKVGSVESEVSRRYIDERPTMHKTEFRRRAANVKQGSTNEVFVPEPMKRVFDDRGYVSFGPDEMTQMMLDYYDHLISQGVAPEQARFYLPQGVETTAIISNSLYGWANFFNQRSDPHAQHEIREIAGFVANHAKEAFPVSWPELT